MEKTYDVSGCQSLMVYGRAVHRRSGAICQLCQFGAGEIQFDQWRQLTVEHLIGVRQGGGLAAIKLAVRERFVRLHPTERVELAKQFHEENTVTACHFCNSMTSRTIDTPNMNEVVNALPQEREEALALLREKLGVVLREKEERVHKKIVAAREAFEERVHPELLIARGEGPGAQG